MARDIVSNKDGTTIVGVPDEILASDPKLKQLMDQARSSGKKSIDWSQGAKPDQRVQMLQSQEPQGPSPQELSSPGMIPPGAPQASEHPGLTPTNQDFSIDPARATGAAYRGSMPYLTAATAGGAVGGPPGAAGGAMAMGLAKAVGDPLTDLYNQYIVPNLPKELQNSVLGGQMRPSDALEKLFTAMGVPEPKSESERMIQAIADGASGAGEVSATGKVLATVAKNPVVKRVGRALAADERQQVVGGAAAGGITQLAKDEGADPLSTLGIGLVAGALGAGTAGLKTTPRGTLPADVAAAEQNGVRVMTSDVNPPTGPTGRFIQHLTERNPFLGSGQLRQGQQEERVKAVQGMLDEYGVGGGEDLSKVISADLIDQRASELGKYTQMKNEVFNKVSQPKLVGSEPQAPQAVPMNSTTQAIDQQIAKLKSLKSDAYTPVIAKLEDWKQAIQGQDIGNIEELRKQIGQVFKDPSMASVRTTGEKALQSIYPAVKQDMGDYIKANGGAAEFNKWSVANAKLGDMMTDLQKGSLKSALDKGDVTPETINTLLFSTKPSDVKVLFRGLSEEGRQSAKVAILTKAMQNATMKGGDINPDTFSTQLRKLGSQIGVFFNEDDIKRIDGLSRALALTKRAPEAIVDPPTGLRTFIPTSSAALAAWFGGGVQGFLGAVGAGFGLGAITRMYESKPVRDILLKIPQTVRGSKEEAALVKRLLSTYTLLQPATLEANDITKQTQKQFFQGGQK